MLPDLGFVVAAFADGITITIERPSATTYPLGVATSAAPTTETVEAVVLPSGGRALARESDGDATKELIEVYVVSSVSIQGSRPSGTGAPLPPDVLIFGGVRYVVQSTEAWGAPGYSRVTALREDA